MDRLLQRMSDERGAVAIVVAFILPLLLILFAVGSGSAVLTVGERQLQRAAAAGALAAAAQLPLVNPAELNDVLAPLIPGPGLFPGEPTARKYACPIIEANLAGPTMLAGFAPATSGTCAGESLIAPADVRIELKTDYLGRTASELQTIVNTLDGLLTLPIPVDIANLLPTVIKPQVTVTATSRLRTPLQELTDSSNAAGQLISADATARRRFKNVLVLPTTDVLCSTSNLPVISLGGISVGVASPQSLESFLEAEASGGFDVSVTLPLLGELTGTVPLGAVGDQLLGDLGGFLTDNDCTIDLNLGEFEAVRTTAFNLLDTVATNPLFTSLLNSLPVPLSATCLIDSIKFDLGDLYDPITAGDTPPTADQILAAAMAENSNVLIYLVGITNATGIPILDAVPVAAQDLANGDFLEVPEANGIYRASLIDERPLTGGPRAAFC